jgi:hypothetical protein
MQLEVAIQNSDLQRDVMLRVATTPAGSFGTSEEAFESDVGKAVSVHSETLPKASVGHSLGQAGGFAWQCDTAFAARNRTGAPLRFSHNPGQPERSQ